MREKYDNLDDWILRRIVPTCNALKIMSEYESADALQCELPELLQSNEGSMNIFLSEGGYLSLGCRNVGSGFRQMLQTVISLKRKPVVYLLLTGSRTINLSGALECSMSELHVINMSKTVSVLTADRSVGVLPYVTHLTITGHVWLYEIAMLAISTAVTAGKLPRLKSLFFAGANVSHQIELIHKLVSQNGTHLNLSHSENKSDIKVVGVTSSKSCSKSFHLLIYPQCFYQIQRFFVFQQEISLNIIGKVSAVYQ